MDAALADHITQFGKGALEFAAGTENEGNGSIASDDASSAGTIVASASPRDKRSADTNSPKFAPQRLAMSAAAAANEMREGDLVRLKHGLEGSSVLVPQRKSDNTVTADILLLYTHYYLHTHSHTLTHTHTHTHTHSLTLSHTHTHTLTHS